MKKILLFLLVALLIGGSATFASANLIQNASFEVNDAYASPTNFYNWNEYGQVWYSSYARTGSYSAMLQDSQLPVGSPGNNSGLVSDKINITELGTYEFGAWFALKSIGQESINPADNNDRVGVTTNIYFESGTGLSPIYPNLIYDIGAAPVTWTFVPTAFGYLSNWFFIGGTFDVTAPVLNGELNIYLQNWDTMASSVFIDDAYLAKVPSVPEPSTMLLLGIGLVGLAGFGRKKFLKK